MNHTVVMDQHEADKRTENRFNVLLRRCKIGNVTLKRKVRAANHGWYGFPLNDSFPLIYMPKCGCRIGSTCGNAACPHMPIATSSPLLKEWAT